MDTVAVHLFSMLGEFQKVKGHSGTSSATPSGAVAGSANGFGMLKDEAGASKKKKKKGKQADASLLGFRCTWQSFLLPSAVPVERFIPAGRLQCE